MTIIRIPRRFYDDHEERELPTPPPVRETARHVWIETANRDAAELLADARYYADQWGPDCAPPGIVASAKATVKQDKGY